MKKKNKLLSLAMIFVFAVAFLVPSFSMPATALADPDVDSGYTDSGWLDVNTDDADNIEDDEATLWASFDVDEDDYDDERFEIEEYGFFYGTDEDELDDVEILLENEDDTWDCKYEEGTNLKYSSSSEMYKFRLKLTDLDEDDETIYFRAYIEYTDNNEDETYYSLGDINEFDVDEGTSADEPEVSTGSATEIDADSAVLNGTLESFGGDDEITEYGFYYGTSSSPSTKKKIGNDNIDEDEDFDYELTGLKADTKYYFKAYAKNSEGIAYGNVKSFTTKQGIVINTNPSVFTIGLSSYLLNGTYQVMDAAPYIKNSRTYLPIRYVGYAMGLTDAQIQWYEATRTVILTKGNTTVVLIIGSNTMFVNGVPRTMDVPPEITNSRTCLPIAWVASAFGTTATWDPGARTVTIPAAKTEPGATGQADVTTSSASGIGYDYATLNGKVTSGSGFSISEFGFYYDTNKSEVTDGRDGSADEVRASGSKDSFYKKVTSLDEDTTYYFMAYAIDANDNISYGTVKSFTTKADDADKPSVSTRSATGIDDDTATLNGRITSFGDDDEITEYGFYWGTTSSPSKKLKVGDDEDNIDEGDDFDYDLGSLKSGTTYYFKAYAKNSDGTAYGSVKSFKTTR